MVRLTISPGIDGLPTESIPDDPQAFTGWFKNIFLSRWAANADVRNAQSGPGIAVTGDIGTAATISIDSTVTSLFGQPYLLVGAPIGSALTGYRDIAVQAGVLTLTDAGATLSLTLGVATNGIGNTQLRQGAAASVIGNATNTLADVADIDATVDNTTLVRQSGVLSFTALPLAAIAQIATDTVLGNVTAGLAAPIALSQAQLTALVNVATTSVSGACPVLSGTSTTFLNGSGAFSMPAYPTSANPSASVGLNVVNGSSANFMRADGAPALDVTIAPTWTGAHTFAATSGTPLTVGGIAFAGVLSAAITNTSTVATQEARLTISAGSENIVLECTNQNRATALITNGPTTPQAVLRTLGAIPLVFGTNNTYCGQFSGTGALQLPISPLTSATTQIFTGLANFKSSLSTSANATLTADAALTVTCNETGWYDVDAYLAFFEATSGAGGFQFDFNGGGATIANPSFAVNGFSTAAFTNAAVTSISTATSIATIGTASATPSWARVKGTIQVTVAGTVAIRWAQASILAIDPTTLAAGSNIILTKIG